MSLLTEQPHAAPRDDAPETRTTAHQDRAEGGSPRWGRIPLLLLVGAAICYFVCTYRIAISKEPFIDEGWFASPAYNLAFHGFMGSSVMEPRGTWLTGDLKGIKQYTYADMPLYLVALAGWFKLVGFGLLRMRLLSVLWGILALTSFYLIVERVAQNRLAASLTVFMMSIDFTFLWSAADGRMDMMCIALGSSALAFYLTFRERNFELAFFGANCLTAASVFTHPNGVAWTIFLGVLVLIYDRRRLSPRIFYAAIPYAAFLVGWAAYIAKAPEYFLAQFSANAHVPGNGTRGMGLAHPARALQWEMGRYVSHFSHGFWAAPVPSYGIWIPVLFIVLWAAALVRYIKTREKAIGVFVLLVAVCFLLLTFGDVAKLPNYLSLIIPLYLATGAVWFCLQDFRGKWFWLRCVPLALLLVIEISVLQTKLLDNPLKDDFEPTVALLQSMPNAKVTADPAFAFAIGYNRLDDDARLGMYTGRKPDIIVADKWYYFDWWFIFPKHDPQAEDYVNNLLRRDYHRVFGSGWYVVYQRNDFVPAASTESSQSIVPGAARAQLVSR